MARRALLGEKLGMTQIWMADGGFYTPVTVVQVNNNVVTQLKTHKTDGYDAIQIAYGDIDAKKITKPIAGHFKAAGVKPKRFISEFRADDVDAFKVGQELTIDTFALGEYLDVSGTTKGKGFAGVMKRHGFKGVSSSHGAHLNHRKPGSVGACATPSRIFKGLRMAGRMGGVKKTQLGARLVGVDTEKGYLLIKGSIPGSASGIVMVSSASKNYDVKSRNRK